MGKRVVAIVGLVGCSQPPPPVDPLHAEPPPRPEPASPDGDWPAFHREEDAGVFPGTPPLNGRTEDGQTIYARSDGTCAWHRPPDPDEQRPPGDLGPAIVVDCPPGMVDPIWRQCHYGTFHPMPDGRCQCARFGNPPPPRFAMSRCPVDPSE